MLDNIDLEIIKILKKNCKIQYRDIGELVHLTGQAVSNRISRMERLGIIRGYTVLLDEHLSEKKISAHVTVFMKTNDHNIFHTFLKNNDCVIDASRISGDGCYLLKIMVDSQEELNLFLDQILKYGNYRVSIAIGKIK
ncbi:Lrp/AsnC family transcriptional regulator [Dendrosporobacter sp. 1207_IL3150]|uniref:Lrp/AsnC family transcriptional regulator n=1 Tax=Dendrosporobacter sp. 1207_IL3150 TaxID=3084054 RepID=UPI002FD89A54